VHYRVSVDNQEIAVIEMMDMPVGSIGVLVESKFAPEYEGHRVLRIDGNIYVDLDDANHWDNPRGMTVRLLKPGQVVSLEVK
jgi:hypothetical protein